MNAHEPFQDFEVAGMDCPSCANAIENALSRLPGVDRISPNIATGKVRVAGAAGADAIIECIGKAGYSATAVSADDRGIHVAPIPNFVQFLMSRDNAPVLIAALLAVPVALLTELAGIENLALRVFAVIALAIAAIPVLPKAFRSIFVSQTISIHVLMTIACVGAVTIGAYAEAAMVMVLFGVGEALEAYTGLRARRSIASLVETMPDTALVETPEGLQKVAVRELKVEDRIVVRPGERIAADGVIEEGRTSVDESALTGESMAVEKQEGDSVYGGSMNHTGSITVGVTAVAQDSLIGRIVQMVEEAQERKAPTERYVDRFAKYYTPAVVVLAAGVAIVPPVFLGAPFWNPETGGFGWLYRGLALLVVACPCALVISTPVSIVSAIARGARIGILFKGGSALETLARVRSIAFDKTGTLTQGRPVVARIQSNGGQAHPPHPVDEECQPCAEVLALAHAVEQRSEHPLAHAIANAAADVGVQERYPAASSVSAVPGSGVSGQVNGDTIAIGRSEEPPCEPGDHGGCTAVAVRANGKIRGTIHLVDAARPDTKEAIENIRALGIERLVMLTGDNARAAESIADAVGLSEVRAGLKPDEKRAWIRTLHDEAGPVAMTGDGINDAPALAEADVGIAVAGDLGGTAQAMETADITLSADDLRALPRAIRLARDTLGTVRMNIVIAIGVKLLFLVAVLMGVGTMWMAVMADMGTSLIVTLNAMRLLRWNAG